MYKATAPIFSTPAVDAASATLIFASVDGTVTALTHLGELKWQCSLAAQVFAPLCLLPFEFDCPGVGGQAARGPDGVCMDVNRSRSRFLLSAKDAGRAAEGSQNLLPAAAGEVDRAADEVSQHLASFRSPLEPVSLTHSEAAEEASHEATATAAGATAIGASKVALAQTAVADKANRVGAASAVGASKVALAQEAVAALKASNQGSTATPAAATGGSKAAADEEDATEQLRYQASSTATAAKASGASKAVTGEEDSTEKASYQASATPAPAAATGGG